jgi:N-acetyl-gamma-glutamyl-phosphate reductase
MENSGKIKVGIVGVTGYAGQEILRILLNHPNVIISRIFSHSYVGKKISSIYKNFLNICDLVCEDGEDLIEISKTVDVIFLSLPHGIASEKVVEEVIKNCKVIDLGADFRLKDPKEYEE